MTPTKTRRVASPFADPAEREVVGGHFGEDLRAVTHVDVGRVGEATPRVGLRVVVAVEAHQLARLVCSLQRLEEQAVDEGKDGRVCTDAQGEDEDRGE